MHASKVVEGLHGNRFEDKEWFVGRTHKSLRGIKKSQFIHSKFGCTFDNEKLRVADFVPITSCKVSWI
jgi:hypothetical protein